MHVVGNPFKILHLKQEHLVLHWRPQWIIPVCLEHV